MPLYEYECSKCQYRFERLQRFSDPPVSDCPECGGAVSQLLSAPAIQFKGSGWYVTDYAHKNTGPAPSSGNGKGNGSSAGEVKAEAKSEAKSEAKTETKSSSTPTATGTK